MQLTYWMSTLLIRIFTRILFGLRVQGSDKIPRNGHAIIAANHQSYLDPPILGACLKREVRFLAKSYLFRWPILGPIIRHFKAIPVGHADLDLIALRNAANFLEDGGIVILFPEGGVSQTGDFQQGEGGVGFLAGQTNADVYPVYIGNTRGAWRRMLKRKNIEVIFGDPIRFANFNADRKRQAYLAFSNQVMEQIAALKVASI